jgi:hypothetical protein
LKNECTQEIVILRRSDMLQPLSESAVLMTAQVGQALKKSCSFAAGGAG